MKQACAQYANTNGGRGGGKEREDFKHKLGNILSSETMLEMHNMYSNSYSNVHWYPIYLHTYKQNQPDLIFKDHIKKQKIWPQAFVLEYTISVQNHPNMHISI